MKNKSLTAAIIALMPLCAAARDFVHPGLSYTDDDLERMRSAIAIGVEPAMSTYEALKASRWTQFEADEITPVERIYESQFNNTVGADGRRIHDLALLYRLSGDRRYADEAVRRINRYKDLRGCSARGTAPLDNGKIYLMIEGAELLRDYDGWSDDDRKAFADMLLYPGYSDTTYPDERRDGFNDEANDINFYWNICNFDTGRWGNQGLFAARALIAIGVFLDNEKIYDRAMRYLLGLEARADDIPYSSNTPERVKLNSDNGCMRDYQVSWYDSGRQFISDEALQYYIYANGQSQEACRDQGHAMVGVGLYTDIAEPHSSGTRICLPLQSVAKNRNGMGTYRLFRKRKRLHIHQQPLLPHRLAFAAMEFSGSFRPRTGLGILKRPLPLPGSAPLPRPRRSGSATLLVAIPCIRPHDRLRHRGLGHRRTPLRMERLGNTHKNTPAARIGERRYRSYRNRN